MFNVLAKSFMTATRNDPFTNPGRNAKHHTDRFGTRRDAEIDAHLIARRRD